MCCPYACALLYSSYIQALVDSARWWSWLYLQGKTVFIPGDTIALSTAFIGVMVFRLTRNSIAPISATHHSDENIG